jgi:hypothetical protein
MKYNLHTRFEVFTAVNIQIEVWVVTPQCCGRISTFLRTLLPPSSGSKVLRNDGILPQHYTRSQLKILVRRFTKEWVHYTL